MRFLKPPSYGHLTSLEGRTGFSITLQVRILLPRREECWWLSTAELSTSRQHSQPAVLAELPDRVLVPPQLPFPFRVFFSSSVWSFPLLGSEGLVECCGVDLGRCRFTSLQPLKAVVMLGPEYGLQSQKL